MMHTITYPQRKWTWMLVSFAFLLGGFILFILANKALNIVAYSILIVVMGSLTIITLHDWRVGLLLFFIWITFEDLPRKFAGNNMLIFIGKDVLVTILYISFFLHSMKSRIERFYPPFWIPLAIMLWYSVLQVFNPFSPSILYGVVGIRIYFFYIPLMFLGYALITSEMDLRRFLQIQAIVALIVTLLGIIQAIVGLDFLNPAQTPDSLKLLYLMRKTPISKVIIPRTTSVFVSNGRFAWYLFIMFILMLGGSAYYYYSALKSRRSILLYVTLGVVFAAIITNGARNVLLFSVGTLFVFVSFMLRYMEEGAEKRFLRFAQRLTLGIGSVLLLITSLFPDQVSAYWNFYTETLLPGNPTSQLARRSLQDPFNNFLAAFTFPHWYVGEGIGTTSLGVKYVVSFFQVSRLERWVESGFGTLIVEMGPLGLLLWLAWTLSLLYHGWKVCRRLAGTALFPLAFTLWWFMFVLLFPKMWLGMQAYQNYINNAYLWLLVGVLFRLPSIIEQESGGLGAR